MEDVRLANVGDLKVITNLMKEKIYLRTDIDIKAMAAKYLQNHLLSCNDDAGLIQRQRIFIAHFNENPVGMIRIADEKAGNFRISDFILAYEHRDAVSLKDKLLKIAEQWAIDLGARNIFIQISKENDKEIEFFNLYNDYIISGEVDAVPEISWKEVILYKLLKNFEKIFNPFDEISVCSFSDNYYLETIRLLNNSSFSFLSNKEAARLIEECYQDKNIKIYIAVDNQKALLGLLVAENHGNCVKLYPITTTSQATSALLIKIPSFFENHRFLLYSTDPSTDEVIFLQKFGWHLDSVLPGINHDALISYIWSYYCPKAVVY